MHATLTIWPDRVDYRIQTTLTEGEGGSIPYSHRSGDRTRTLALGEAMEVVLRCQENYQETLTIQEKNQQGTLTIRVLWGF